MSETDASNFVWMSDEGDVSDVDYSQEQSWVMCFPIYFRESWDSSNILDTEIPNSISPSS